MNQNFFEQVSLTNQFYRAFGNYYGVHTTTTSQASEYLSSARTQPSTLKKQKNTIRVIKSPQHLNKPLTSNSIRVKTQTQHIPKQQPISHHVKSLSSDVTKKTPLFQRTGKIEKVMSQSEASQHPFLIIQKKARELRRLESRKSTHPSVQTESQHSIQSIKNKTIETPIAIHIPSIPVIQVTEPQEQHSPKMTEKSSELELEKDEVSQEEQQFTLKQMKRVSVKLKFKNAVQSQVSTLFINKQPKSLFNVIISPEFSLKHQKERQQISECFEAGNFILGKIKIMTENQSIQRSQCIKQRYIIKHMHKMTNIVSNQQVKLNTTNKAFQRKIKMIITTTENSKEIEQPQQFSLLAKQKKSQFSKWQSNEQVETVGENYKDHIMITITNDLKEETVHTFSRPKFTVAVDTVLEEIPQASSPSKSNISIPKRLLQHSGSLHHQSLRQINFKHQSSGIKDESLNSAAMNFTEENNNLDFNQEFCKANLYVRLYYQSILYKLQRKTTFTGMNLQEIEEYFVALLSMIKVSHINFQTTDVQGVEQILPSNTQEQMVDIQKYQVPSVSRSLAFDFDRQSSCSSESSNQSSSLDQMLEEPNQRLSNVHEHESRMQSALKSKRNLEEEKEDLIFIDDDDKNHIFLSIGQLVPIRKAKNHFHIPLDLKCIVSVLNQQTKNILLTFHQQKISLDKILNEINQDTDGQAFKQLDKYHQNLQLRHRIVNEMELRFEAVLVGRYKDDERVIDIEHKENITLLEDLPEIPQLPEIRKIESHKPIESSTSYNNNRKQESQILEIVRLKKQAHQSKQLKSKQTPPAQSQPKLNSKQTNNSPEQNIAKQQFSNQLTNQLTNNNNANTNMISQSTTQYLTKPTNQSQQSVKVASQKVIQKSKSNADLSESSSAKSLNSKSDLNSSRLIQVNSHHIQKSQQFLDVQAEKKTKLQEAKSYEAMFKIEQIKNQLQTSSMQQSSLRMRSHAQQCEQRQKYDQKYQVKFAIEDNNFQEFLENFVQLPEMYTDYRFDNKDTFLTMAAQNGNSEIVKELIRRGADINIQNDDGNTPLHLALAYNHYNIADILMENGASSHIINKLGKNAWSVL